MSNTAFVLKQLFAAYPNAQVHEGTVAMYYRLLQDIPVEQLQVVVDECVATHKFLPTVAEVREKYYDLAGAMLEQSAAEAWGSVELAIRRVTRYGTPRFKDPRVAKVVEMMGWQELCNSDKPAVDRAQFMRMYAEVAEREQKVERLLPQGRAMLEAAAEKMLEIHERRRLEAKDAQRIE